MTETFATSTASSIGSSNVVLLGPVPTSTTYAVIGLTLANIYTSSSVAGATAYVSNSSPSGRAFLIRVGQVPYQQTLPLVGPNSRLVLENGDSLVVAGDATNALDGIVSYLVVT